MARTANPTQSLTRLMAFFALTFSACLVFAWQWQLALLPALLGSAAVAALATLAFTVRSLLLMHRDTQQLTDLIRHRPVASFPLSSAPGHLAKLGTALEHQLNPLRKELQAALRTAGRMRSIFEQSDDAILIIDADTLRVSDCNPRACALLGRDWSQLRGTPLASLLQQPDCIQDWRASNSEREQLPGQRVTFIGSASEAVHLEISLSRVNADGRGLLLLMGRDLSERDEAQHRIQHLAYHDTLTNLPNRTLLHDRVNRALKRTRRSRQIGALLFLDLDNFKRINDSLGHSVGDQLLSELSRRLQHGLREEDTISRLGGDEFVILIEHLGTEHQRAERQVREIAEKIRQILSDAYQLNGHELHVTGSIGFTTFPRDGETMETLLRHADLAMYQAKKAGRNTITRFEQKMDELATERLRIEGQVRNAIRDGDLHLYFQPVQRIRDGRMLGAEALLRWIHPQEGEITPDRFLPQIEDSALMLDVSDWVMLEACRCLADIARNRELYTPDYIAINISHQQFHQPDFVRQVEQVLEQTGADPKHLLFEITETVIMNDTGQARESMLALKRLGIRFAIDDFGTGYSSLSYLKQLPADTLKIDKSFVDDVATDSDDAAIVKTILGIADHMGMCVIAEGVETYDQLNFLRNNNCTYYQGYLARPPLSLVEFHEELRHSQFLRVVQ